MMEKRIQRDQTNDDDAQAHAGMNTESSILPATVLSSTFLLSKLLVVSVVKVLGVIWGCNKNCNHDK